MPAHDLYTGRRPDGRISDGCDSGEQAPNVFDAHVYAPGGRAADGRAADFGGVIYKPSYSGVAASKSAANAAPNTSGAASNVYANKTANMANPASGNARRQPGPPYAAPAPTAPAAAPPVNIKRGKGRSDEIAGALADILEQEALLYQDAAEISIKKTDIIVHGKIEELDSLVKAEQAIILKIGRLEDERENIVLALSEELDLNLEGVTLTDINAHLSDESFSRLDGCQKSLARTLGGLKNTNDMNSQLIQNALDYVNFSVNLLTTNQDSGNIYTQDGGDDAGKGRRSIFDVKL